MTALPRSAGSLAPPPDARRAHRCRSRSALARRLRQADRRRPTRRRPARSRQPLTPGRFREGRRPTGASATQRDDKDKDVALNYAAALRRTGRTDQAVAVLQKAAIYSPGRPRRARRLRQGARRRRRPRAGARRPSAGRRRRTSRTGSCSRPRRRSSTRSASNDEARKLYAQALDLAPNEPIDPVQLRHVLRADRRPRRRPRSCCARRSRRPAPTAASARTSRWSSACRAASTRREKIAGAELSPDQAAANVAYLKQMLAQQNSWQKLKAGGKPTG